MKQIKLLTLTMCLAIAGANAGTGTTVGEPTKNVKETTRYSDLWNVSIEDPMGGSYNYIYTPGMVFSQELIDNLKGILGTAGAYLDNAVISELVVAYWGGNFNSDDMVVDWTNIKQIAENVIPEASFTISPDTVSNYNWLTGYYYSEAYLYIDGVIQQVVNEEYSYDNVTIHKITAKKYTEPASIVETNNNAALRVYPNPTAGKLHISISDMRLSDIKIYDIFGKLQMSEIGQSEITIDISHLPSGMYFLKTGEQTVKVVKE